MRVFLTGGTGLLGSHVAERLTGRGDQVVALYRHGSDTRVLEALGCSLVSGDVQDSVEDLAASMAGCHSVVHGAALVYGGGSWPRVRGVNVEGTRRVLTAAARAGVGHAVHLSSVAVYGTTDGMVDEDTPVDTPVPTGDLYARSKRESEVAVREIELELGLRVTVLRPSAVYGERDRLLVPVVAKMLRSPVVASLGKGRNSVPVVYAGNVAAAIEAALDSPGGRRVFDVGMDHPLTQRQLIEGIARGMGRRPTWVTVPATAVRVGAAAMQRLGVSTPGAPHLPISRVARLALGENPYPSTRIRDELGWRPPFHHPEALERTGRWADEMRRARSEE